MKHFKNKVTVITGAGSGIGQAHQHERGQPVAAVHLHFDDGAFQTNDGARVYFGEHAISSVADVLTDGF